MPVSMYRLTTCTTCVLDILPCPRLSMSASTHMFPLVTTSDLQSITRRAYDARAQDYAEYVADPANEPALMRPFILAFADLVAALPGFPCVLDAGCGPGHWTALLHDHGLAACGVDLASAMITIARRARPDIDYAVGSLLEIDAADDTFGGVLAHYSLIHLEPGLVPAAIAEFARVLAPDGYLLLGFQSAAADPWTPFGHGVTPAYAWSIDAMARWTAEAGLVEIGRLVIPPRDGKQFQDGYLLVRNTSGPGRSCPAGSSASAPIA